MSWQSKRRIMHGYLHGQAFIDYDGSSACMEYVDQEPEGPDHEAAWYVYCGLDAGWQECSCGEQAMYVEAMSEEEAESWAWVRACEAEAAWLQEMGMTSSVPDTGQDMTREGPIGGWPQPTQADIDRDFPNHQD